MNTLLLATRLQIPPLSRYVIYRERLTSALESDISQYKLILLSAPAGYGKTTLLTQWANASHDQVAWLSISAEDNDLERFLRYMLAAWEYVQPEVMQSEAGLLLGDMSPDSQAVLVALINYANTMSAHLALVLDDYHLITDAAIHEALTFLLDHAPPTLHVVLSGRAEPPLSLARYRARGEMREFRAEDLRFLPGEAADFLNQSMNLHLPSNDVLTLQSQLEGWIAGLQLAAVSLQRHHVAPDKLVVTGKHRFIADYLSEDVLAPLPEDLRQFMLQTSILDRLCGALCEAVTGRDDGQAMLEAIERENLFLVRLDEKRAWFRFHHLFAEFLREELRRHTPEPIAGLHRRAAQWFLDQGLPEQAFRHTVEADDAVLAVRIIDLYLNEKVVGGEIKVVKQWVDMLPPRWLSTHPFLGLARAGFLAATGAFEDCLHCLDEIEGSLMALDHELQREQLAKVTAVRCFVACFQNDLPRAKHLADQALRDLPEEDWGGFRGSLHVSLGDTYRRNGYWQEAKNAYLKVLNVARSHPLRVGAVHIYGALADLTLRQGRLREAEEYWNKALDSIQDKVTWGRVPLPVIGWVHIRMAELQYERNDLDGAWDHLARGLERAEVGGDVRALIAGYLIAGRVKLTQGDHEAAAHYLEQARTHVETAQFAHWLSRFERFQLEVWLAQDRLRAAVGWSDQMLTNAAVEERPESEIAQLAMARVLIVQGDERATQRALARLDRLLAMAENEGRMGITIEALALQALAYWKRGEKTDALTKLERALRLAAPEGYVRLFADLGLTMARLLQEARSRAVMPEYVETLLAAYSPDLVAPTAARTTLPEPLTEREQEILELVAAGLTNREIAETLVISPETVKKHASHIYGKLGVGNRLEAVATARELDLIT